MAPGLPEATQIQVSAPGRLIVLLISLACLGVGSFLAASHPLLPALISGVFLGLILLFYWRPWTGILALPALLPVLNFSPWTGWLIIDEFDLLVLAVLCAGYFRIWRDGSAVRCGTTTAALLALWVLLVGRGLLDLSIEQVNWFAGYMTPLNSLRVGKSLLWVALLLPLVAELAAVRAPMQAMRDVFTAMLIGSGWVVLAVFWERAFYPGLADIFTPYRTVGPFWEMHHGGAALDAYLVLIAPLLVWRWRDTVSLAGRTLLGAFILAFGYACLTTFSRGVVFASVGALIIHAVLTGWRTYRKNRLVVLQTRPSTVVILGLVVVEIFLVVGTDSFLVNRLQETARDFGGRLRHWERAVNLLETPTEWLFGIGLGRVPARLTQGEDRLPLPGRMELVGKFGDRAGLALFGPDAPASPTDFGRYFAVTQRVDLVPRGRHPFSVTARSERPAHVLVQICAAHLLYPARCNGRIIGLDRSGWQTKRVGLHGVAREKESWLQAGHGIFLLSVLTPGTMVEIRDVQLSVDGQNLLRNPQFKEREGRWFSQSFRYFLPWHIDNLYLELLVETGIVGLLAFLAAVFRAMWGFFENYLRGETFSIELLSSFGGLLALGFVVSVIDMPRVAMLAGFLMVWAGRVFSNRSD